MGIAEDVGKEEPEPRPIVWPLNTEYHYKDVKKYHDRYV